MAKNKLQHFADMKTMPFVFEPETQLMIANKFEVKGKWHQSFFKNNHPIIVELGCGKGEYTVELAKLQPNKNFIGIDIKGARIWYGADEVRQKELSNVGFVRTKVDFITSIFAPGEVDEIWLTFSDPQKEKPRKRLTGDLFIERYRQILKPGGIIHLKTDSDLLFEFTLEEIAERGYEKIVESWNIYEDLIPKMSAEESEILNIKTNYEQIFSAKGYSIKYCQFKVN